MASHNLTSNPSSTPIAEAALLGAASVFGIVTLLTAMFAGDNPLFVFGVLAAPVVLALGALVSKSRELLWASIGVCLAYFVWSFVGFGFAPTLMGLSLFGWHVLRSHQVGEPVLRWQDLLTEIPAFVIACGVVFLHTH